MKRLISELRCLRDFLLPQNSKIVNEAADAIEKLQAENKSLHQQLEMMKQDRDYYRGAYHCLQLEKNK